MQEFARDKFSILEQSDGRFSFEQDLDLKHASSSRPMTMLYVELGISVLIIVLIINQVSWTITGSIGVIAVVLAFLSHYGSRWLTEGASCTKVEISKHKNRMKITTFQRDADGQIWHAMAQEHVFDIACLKCLAIMQGTEMKRSYGEQKKNLADDIFVLCFTTKEQNVPVILYMASIAEDVQRIKDQLELLVASPYQMARA